METDGRKKLTRSNSGGGGGSAGLGSFLDAVPKTKTSRGSATVSGDRLVQKEVDGEIYIRADGKRVRRVKKSAVKASSSASVSPAASSAGLGSFFTDSESKLPKKKASGSATVTGYTPSKTKLFASSASKEEGEIFIRPDGKKVRRVKRTVSASAEKPAAATTDSLPASKAAGLGSFFGTGSGSKSRMSGSATVGGDRNVVKEDKDGEVYIRADGKKVRRVKKTAAVPAAEAPLTEKPKEQEKKPETAEERKKKNLESFLGKSTAGTKGKSSASVSGAPSTSKKKDLGSFLSSAPSSKKKMSGSATVSGAPATTSLKLSRVSKASSNDDSGYIYTRPDGKKVRRVKKTALSSAEEQSDSKSGELKKESAPKIEATSAAPVKKGLAAFMDLGSTSKPKMSGSATVTGYTPSKLKKLGTSSVASSKDDGEVYIRADGKKVRRIRKTASKDDSGASVGSNGKGSSPAALGLKNLGNFLDLGDSTKPKMSGSATVTGYTPSKVKKLGTASAASSKDDGEVYIRADGKKVRRVRKPKASDDATLPAKPAGGLAGLGNFFGSQDAVRKPMSGSATVSGLPTSKKSLEGDVYINKDGKKVRRVRKPGSVAGDLATPSTGTGSTDQKSSLSGFLGSNVTSKSKMSGSATVTGYTPSKTKLTTSSTAEEGEIYTRPDGKRVRRVRKPKATDATSSPDEKAEEAGAMEPTLVADKSKIGQAATVAGEKVIKVTPEGEIVLRADGKKVLRRKKPAAETGGDNSEVYRRADGKLVRRVRKGTKPSSAAGDLAGFLHSTKSKAPRTNGDIATVSGDARPKTSIEDLMNYKNVMKKKLPQLDPNIDLSKLTAEQFAIAGSYRIMLQQGLSPEQVHSRMEQDGVGAVIVSAVLKEDLSLSPRRSLRRNGASTVGSLTDAEHEVADGYRKMMKMGMPNDTVRHKMSQDSVASHIVANVMGEKPGAPSLAPLESSDANKASGSNLSAEDEALAATYRKMVKMGLPSDAVKHKMVQDGVNTSVIGAVLGQEATTVPVPAPETPASGKENTPDSGLSADDEVIASRFRKMCTMGLPPDAVRHKMEQEGVGKTIVEAVLGEAEAAELDVPVPSPQPAAVASNLSTDDEGVASKYRKMFKMGLPEDAVRHKMIQDGVTAHIIASVMGDEPPSAGATPAALSSDDEAVASSYRKMFKMGLPENAVRHKMVQDGVTAHVIASVMGGDGGGDTSEKIDLVPTISGTSPAPASIVHPSAPQAPAPTVNLSLSPQEEEVATKYRKMSQMGLPGDAVQHKMVQDGVEQEIIDSVMGGSAANVSAAAIAPSVAGPSDESKFAVVMSPDSAPTPPPVTTVAPLDPNEQFAVDVEGSSERKLEGDVETRLMTLEDIAKATGQQPDQLKEMVKQRRRNSMTMPRFVLTPTTTKPAGDLFEVAVPKNAAGGAPTAGAGGSSAGGPSMASAGLDPKKKYKEVKTGQEVVDSKLADAARAVSALGDLDMKSLLEQLQKGEMEGLLGKLAEAEKRQKKLEKQLAAAGVAIAEDIDYGEAKGKVEEIAKRMNEIGGSDIVLPDKEQQNKLREEYFKLEQSMERYNTALMCSEEYQAEQDRVAQQWEDDNRAGNLEALKKIRRHMPVQIRCMSEAELTNTPSPNGKFLPKATAKKFKRTNVLQCIRLNPEDLERMHPSTLDNMRVTGLTLTERRAIYYHLQSLGPKWERNKAEKMTERKWTWYQMMKNNFKENLAPYQRHVAQYGPPDNHVGCPLLGKQCPIKADKLIDYDGDYGWTDADEYEVSDVKKPDVNDPGAKAMLEAAELAKEKKSNERADLLKKHYKGKLLQVSKANGSCEAMDDSMDKMEYGMMSWIETKLQGKTSDADKKKEVANFTEGLNTFKLATLDFAKRSGMQTSGKRKAGGDGEDIRSSVEALLAGELWECAQEYFKFILQRMKEMDMRDNRVEKTIELLENMLGELHGKNEALLKKLAVDKKDRSRKLRKIDDITKEVQEKMKPKEEEAPPEATGGPPMGGRGGGGRGGLLDALGRGRGRGGGGRGGLMDALKGGRGRGRGGGRGGLLDAISGAKGRGRGRGGGGRGGLLDAIKGGGGDGGGGRGGLMAAIAGRGGRGGGGGGRGGLMAAIAARGGGG